MNDDELRQELERRSQAAPFSAQELLPELRRWTGGQVVKPARFARSAPLAGLAAAAVVALVIIVALSRLGASPGTTLPTVSAAPQPSPQFDCGQEVALVDPLGLAAGCSARIDYSVIGTDRVTILASNLLDVQWTGATCTPIKVVTLDRDVSGVTLMIAEQTPPFPPNAASCAGGPEPVDLHITLATPLVTNLRASLNGQDLPVVHLEPVDASPSAQTGANVALVCSSTMTLIDSTGSVVSCSDSGDVDYHTNRDGASAQPADPHVLHVAWGQNFCVTSQRIAVSMATVSGQNGYAITVRPTSFDPTCYSSPDAHSALIQFAKAVDPATVVVAQDDAVVSCSAVTALGRVGQVFIQDGPGMITGCSQSQITHSNGRPSIANTTPSEAQLVWTDDLVGEIAVTLGNVEGHYQFTSIDSCHSCDTTAYEISVDFANPVDTSSFWLGMNGETPSPIAAAPAQSSTP